MHGSLHYGVGVGIEIEIGHVAQYSGSGSLSVSESKCYKKYKEIMENSKITILFTHPVFQ